MSQSSSIPEKWHNLIIDSLNSDSAQEKIFAPDSLSRQTFLFLETRKELMPDITQSVVFPDAKVRDYARREKNHILDLFPEIETSGA